MMTKQHFEAFAREIRDSQADYSAREYAAELIARIARQFNPRFDYARFWRACGLSESS